MFALPLKVAVPYGIAGGVGGCVASDVADRRTQRDSGCAASRRGRRSVEHAAVISPRVFLSHGQRALDEVRRGEVVIGRHESAYRWDNGVSVCAWRIGNTASAAVESNGSRSSITGVARQSSRRTQTRIGLTVHKPTED